MVTGPRLTVEELKITGGSSASWMACKAGWRLAQMGKTGENIPESLKKVVHPRGVEPLTC